jgi:hypothetical protein
MMGRAKVPHSAAISASGGSYTSDDMAQMQGAIDAVCGELGFGKGPQREAVARRVMAAYETGRRQPLNLVDAGLGSS